MQNHTVLHTCFRCVIIALLVGSYVQPARSTTIDLDKNYAQREEVQDFIDEQVNQKGADRAALVRLFKQLKPDGRVLELIQRAPENNIAWIDYKKIFINDDRLEYGVKFYLEHAEKLERASAEYGVAPSIITAVLGVETYYGKVRGEMKVVRSLTTLAFDYRRRSPFFRRELNAFLQLTRLQGLDPLEPEGSYAGAMGYPQFMPTSYIHYAVDFDRDGKIDIWSEPTDAIGSIAHYLHKAGRWKTGRAMVEQVFPSEVEGFRGISNQSVSATFTRAELARLGVSMVQLDEDENFIPIWLESVDGMSDEFWVGGKNFHSVTRYNSSYYYTMSIYHLAQLIEQRIKGKK